MGKCAFCNASLKGRHHDTGEHVFNTKLLADLGRSDAMIVAQMWIEAKSVIRRVAAKDLKVKGVCNICNSNVFNRIDGSARPLIANLANGRRIAESLSEHEKRDLSWWMLRTACVLDLELPRKERRMPRSAFDAVIEQRRLPSNSFITIVKQVLPPETPMAIGRAISGITYLVVPARIESAPLFKCGIQYGEFLCLFAISLLPGFGMAHALLQPMVLHESDLVLEMSHAVMPDARYLPPTLLNINLANIFSGPSEVLKLMSSLPREERNVNIASHGQTFDPYLHATKTAIHPSFYSSDTD